MENFRHLDLMIGGAQKAGTSSLLRYLAQHPDLHTHAQPEMTFFLQEREHSRGYEAAFRKYFIGENAPDALQEKRLIAKNVMVMQFPEVLQRIYEHNRKVHFVVLLREPVARAYSAYWWARRRGWENINTYEDALAAEAARLAEDRFKWRQCAYQYNSVYYPRIKALITRFGAEQVQCILTDDLKENPEQVCRHIFQRLGVDADFTPALHERHNQATLPRSETFTFLFTQFLASHNPLRRAIRRVLPDATAYKFRKAVLDWNDRPKQQKNSTPPPLNPETRLRQAAYFKPFNEQLAALLGRDLSVWNF